jgi:multidrug efflux pump subunit AcrA (membrane-fusion protein)
MTDPEISQRLAILDQIADVVFCWNRADSASDFQEQMIRAQRILAPLTKPVEIVAPSSGKISAVAVRDGDNVSEDTMRDSLCTVAGENVSPGVVGRIEKVLVKDGAKAEKGQPLVRILAYQPSKR